MARVCEMTDKKGSSGNRRSHSLRATKRTFKANIVKKRVYDPTTGKFVRMKVATSYLRTLAKRLQTGR